ncbi:MAG: hypothetical protein K0Q73_6647 [Paenibacillus sp.]|jgi:uncharacterized protein YcfL|nr:hypothetical protein [Paenibacillus sp.]
MKKIQLSILILITILGCSSKSQLNDSDISGFVVSVESERILVVTNIEKKEADSIVSGGEKLNNNHIQYWISADKNMINKIKEGDKVQVWFKGGVDESLPAKASAKSIKVVNE